MKTRKAVQGWRIVQLGDVLCRVQKPVTVRPDEPYQEIGIRSHGKGIFYKDQVTGDSLGDKRVFWVEPDCFIVNIVFAWEGAVAQTTQAEAGMIASHRFPMYKPVSNLLDLNFLTYFFKSKYGVHLLGLASPGGAGRNKTLGQQEFVQLEIPLPPLAEQRKIADILSTWDGAIDLTEQLIAAKQRRKQGLMQRLLTGEVRFGEYDEPWSERTLQDLVTVTYGKSPSGIQADPGKYAIYGTGGIVGQTNTCLCDQSAVIIGRKGTIDKPILVEQPFWAIDTTFYCLTNANVDIGWFYYAISNVDLRSYNEASGVPSLSRNTLYSIRLHVPELPEQQRIAQVLRLCDEELALHRQKLAALRRQKQGLMQRLLTGAVRVKVDGQNAGG